eukprot:TRINITY_DN16040_c0_g1_i1.p1 TRINITY_DN16040_c0_g1~~TRINITY_DN16040_c0_g1_i1.p1  ORF type:complete len:546 (+),score=108.34 TRINITY_DN16040_c0_g1_i1:66-1703(+)
MSGKKKLTVAELLALKGKRKLVLTTAFDEWTARAAEEAGVDMILGWGNGHEHSKFVVEAVRRGAPNTLIGTGINPGAYESIEKALKLAGEIRAAGTDIIYCSGLVPDKFAGLARQHYPCCGHVGYLPVNDTWLGGPRAVGKTWDEAKKIYDDVMALEAAGCIAVEMEVVPARVAAEITKRTKMLVFSMGSGPDCDGQFIFSEDILGTNSGHYPRHSITYAQLMKDAVKALGQYREAVLSGAYPTAGHSIKIKDEEFARFVDVISHSTVSISISLPPHKRSRKKLTVAELLALKGKRKLVLTTAFDEWTARAAEEAGVDMILGWGNGHEHSKFVVEAVRRGAPNTLIGTGINPGAYESIEKALKLAGEIRAAGTDIIYCSGLVPDKFAGLARQHYPCCGHVGYLPVNDTWLGGPRAVGKTWDEAKKIYDDVMALEAAGCIAVEMEVVPARVAAEITKRTKMLVFSMGSGPDCDGQFIFSEDILGTNSGHYPRHSITYAQLMKDAVKALGQYREAVLSGAYPTAGHSIKIKDEEFARFLEAIADSGH